jgi:hypothetical protein
MGIRYYAYPVTPEHTATAAATPELFLGQDPLSDAWGLVPIGDSIYAMDPKPRPEMLYLDKCWGLLQELTRTGEGECRPAHVLFAGYDRGGRNDCQPFLKALSPSEVATAASGLSTIGNGDLDVFFERDRRGHIGDRNYLEQYLNRAVEFTTDLHSRGWGLVYMIG